VQVRVWEGRNRCPREGVAVQTGALCPSSHGQGVFHRFNYKISRSCLIVCKYGYKYFNIHNYVLVKTNYITECLCTWHKDIDYYMCNVYIYPCIKMHTLNVTVRLLQECKKLM